MFKKMFSKRSTPDLHTSAVHDAGLCVPCHHIFISIFLGGGAVVVDRRVLYTGSPNLTTKSTSNEEWAFKLVGPIVQQVLARIAVYKARFAET